MKSISSVIANNYTLDSLKQSMCHSRSSAEQEWADKSNLVGRMNVSHDDGKMTEKEVLHLL